MYGGVLAVGIVGAVIARFRPQGMARALLAMALAQALVAVIALIAGKHQAPISSVFEIVGLNGLFVALFLGSAWLFRHAARAIDDERWAAGLAMAGDARDAGTVAQIQPHVWALPSPLTPASAIAHTGSAAEHEWVRSLPAESRPKNAR